MKKVEVKSNPTALLPILVFLVLTFGFAMVTGSAKTINSIVFFVIAAAVALLMNNKKSMMEKVDIFAKGAANPNIIIMIMIFLLAGAFSTILKEAGAVSSVVNLSLTVMPSSLLVVGLFIIACFISLSMGTSVGTVVALTPIAMGIVEATGLNPPFVIGAVLGGAMFGDNLSVVSDTTIAATRLCGVEMKDKFKVNFLIVLPAAIATCGIIYIQTIGKVSVIDVGTYELFKIVPYVLVLALALIGFNVFTVLGSGIVLAGTVGFMYGEFTLIELLQAFHKGMTGMFTISIIVLIVGGIIGIMTENGGIQWIIDVLRSRTRSKKGGAVSIALLTSILDIFIANNTVAIVTAAPVAMEITEEYGIDPRRTASYLDIFACAVQANLPYGGMLLATAAASGLDAVSIIPYATYAHLVLIMGFVAIAFDYPKIKDSIQNQSPKLEQSI